MVPRTQKENFYKTSVRLPLSACQSVCMSVASSKETTERSLTKFTPNMYFESYHIGAKIIINKFENQPLFWTKIYFRFFLSDTVFFIITYNNVSGNFHGYPFELIGNHFHHNV